MVSSLQPVWLICRTAVLNQLNYLSHLSYLNALNGSNAFTTQVCKYYGCRKAFKNKKMLVKCEDLIPMFLSS
jgi:hypothetical protein